MKKIYTSFVFLCFLVNLTYAQCNLTFIPHTTSICHGNCATVSVSGAETYLWMPGGLTDSVVSLCPNVTTIYTVTGTDAASNTCSAMDTITVNPNPVVTPTATPSTICNGASSNLSASSSVVGTTYVWIPGAFNDTPVSVTPASTTTYTVTGTTSVGCTGSNTVTVTVNPNPNITTTATPASICNGDSSSLLAISSVVGTTFVWNPGGFTGMPVTVTPVSTTIYTVTGTSPAGCTGSDFVAVTVNQILSPLINCGVSTVSSVSFTWNAIAGATGYSVSYQVNAGPVVNVGPIGNVLTYSVSGLSGGDYVTITVTPMGGAGTCFTSSTISCTAISCTPPTANISYASPFCVSIITPQPVTLTGTGGYTGGTFSASPLGLNINGSSGDIIPSASAGGTYTVSYTVAGVGGCPGITTITSVTIDATIIPTFNPIPSICSGAYLAPLPTTSINGITGTWSPSPDNTSTTIYTFTPAAGQCATTSTLTVTVNPNITPFFMPVAPICSGAALAPLPATSNNGITGTWSPAINNTATTTYTYMPTSGQCATTSTLTITVNPYVTPTFNSIGPLCQNSTPPIQPLSSTNIPPITGTWNGPISTTAVGTYLYTFSPAAGACATIATMSITVNPNIIPTFNPVAPINYGDPLTALPTTSLNGITGTWAPAPDNTITTTYVFTPDAGLCAVNTTLTIVVIPNAIDENTAAEALVVYPNPTSERLFINFDELNAIPKTMKLFNALGQVCFETNMPLQTNMEGINVANMDHGTYNLQIVFEKGTVNRTVIVN